MSLRVALFDDVVFARRENFHIPGLDVDVFAHADDAVRHCDEHAFDVVFMDFAMGPGRKSGAIAVKDLRDAGFRGHIIGISSDPAANAAMARAGANDSLGKKAHLRSYMVYLGRKGLPGQGARHR